MKIQVNGQALEVAAEASVAELLTQLGTPRYVAVEVNGEVVTRSRHAATKLEDGDVVELVTLVGGG